MNVPQACSAVFLLIRILAGKSEIAKLWGRILIDLGVVPSLTRLHASAFISH